MKIITNQNIYASPVLLRTGKRMQQNMPNKSRIPASDTMDMRNYQSSAFGILMSFKAKFSNEEKPEPSPEEKKKFLQDAQITQDYAETIRTLRGREWQRAVELIQSEIIPDCFIADYASIKDEDNYMRAKELANQGISHGEILDRVSKPDFETKYARYNELLAEGYDTFLMPKLIDADKTQLTKADEITSILKSKGTYSQESTEGLSACLGLKEKEFENIKKLVTSGMKDLFTVADLAKKDDDTIRKATELFTGGYPEREIGLITGLSGERFEKADKLVTEYKFNNRQAFVYSGYDDDKLQRITEIKELDEDDKTDNSLFDFILNLSDEEYSELKKLMAEGYDPESLQYGYLKENIERFSRESALNEQQWNDFLASSENRDKYSSQLSKKDIFFLKNNAFNNKFYTPEEYVDSFIYFKNLKTKTGKGIFSCEEFFDKFPRDSKAQKFREKSLYNNIKAVLEKPMGGVEMSYLQSFLELMEEGVIQGAALRKLSPEDSLYLAKTNTENPHEFTFTISSEIKKDIDVLYDTVFNSPGMTKSEIDKKITEQYVKTYKTESDALKSSEKGDVFKLSSEDTIRIKTGDEKSERIKLSKEAYTELFPPYERFVSSQQLFGNCYCIEVLMSLYADKNFRFDILKCFEEDAEGNIKITIGDYPEVTFENGELPASENENEYSSGAKGFKLLEYAYSQTLVEDEIKNALEKLTPEEQQRFSKFINDNPGNFFIYEDNGKPAITTYSEAKNSEILKKGKKKYQSEFKSFNSYNGFLSGNSGQEYCVYKKFGLNPQMYYSFNTRQMSHISKSEIKKIYEETGVEGHNLHKKNDLNKLFETPGIFEENTVLITIAGHAYGLRKESDGNGKSSYYIYNPHNQGFPIKVDDITKLTKTHAINNVTVAGKQ